ncbi:tape measure protein [Lepagella muris]|uniref:Uncharacterized protein n=1 Tax=Lepagella muris TaxID=3032870 RepID=A0AC61RL14_9BACT|nr:tape measure protein [Lepagella muris]TGY80981.1 hypothetical protein E5331_00955 [Lepagella muris]THG54059.1 hypothetical protein E5984_00955 [Bacteroidales bacterium]TKC56686.1 hypothetical protein E5359_013070 [Bacteroidales bacterium]
MPLLSFEVYSNYEEVARLRSEITMLENRLRSFGPGTSVSTIRAVEAQLQSARAKFRGLALDAAQAGASLELNIRKGANGAIAAINDLQQKLTDPIQGLTQIAGVAGLGMFLNNVTKIRGQFQLMETNINTLLGGAEKGQAMMAELTEYAKVSPLDFQGTVGAAQMMLGFGIDQQKILPFMKALGDVSMGDAQRFQSLTLAFSQMSAAGKLMGQDLMQMVNAGFQPLDQLAKDTGKSIGQLKDEMSQGKISAEMVQQAFINATSEGGKFYNMSQAATATITGQMSMLGDATDLMFNGLGKKSEDAIIKVIEGATWMVENYEKVGGVLGTAIATFGIYKASAMASEFAIKVASEERSKAVVQGFEEEIAKMEEYQRQRALLAFDEDVRSALETGSISSEMAEKIQALREEVGMRKEAAQAAVDAARTEQAAINDALKAANEKVDKAQEMVDVANQIGTAEEQAAAANELLTAQMEREALTTQLANSQTRVHEAEMALDAAATQSNTISQIQQTNATNANTAAQNTNTVATGRGRIATALSTAGNKIATVAQYAYTTAINTCTKAWQSLKVAFATNSIGLIITALTTVIGLFMTFKNETEEATSEMERFGEAATKTKSNVNTLYSVLDSVNKESKVYKDSLEELTKIAKDYGIQIDSEKDTLDQLNEKRAQLIALIEKEGEARQIANRIASYEEDKKKNSDDFVKNMAESIADESKKDAKDNADRFARIIADTVDRKKAELLPLINELEQLQREYATESSKGEYADASRMAELHKRIASLQNNIAKTANEEAKNYAKAMGMAEDYILDIKDTSKLVGELTKQITTADNFIKQTQANAKAVNDELERTKDAAPPVDYSTFDSKKLTEELTKVSNAVDDINKTPVKPLSDPINIHSLIETAQKAEEKISDVDNSSASPKTDNSALDETAQKGEKAEDKIKDIDNTTATPYIDTKYLDIALSKLDNIKISLKEVGGQVLNTSGAEREQLQSLMSKYGKNGKLDTKQMSKEDVALYNQIVRNARLRSNFSFEGNKYKLNSEQSAILQQFIDRYGTSLNESKMSDVDKRLYQQLKNDLRVGAYNANKNNQTGAMKAIKDALENQIKTAKTTEEFANIRKSINAQMQKVDQSSELYKYYEKQLKALDKRDKTKKDKNSGKDDPKQRAYELRKARLEEEKRTNELLQAEKNRQRELEIAQMEDNSEKEIATIKFTSEKKRQALEAELKKEASILEKNAMQDWMKGGKNRKEYQYYEQFTDKQLAEMRKQYQEQARSNIGYDTQLSLIANNEASELQKVHQTDMTAMRDYLKEYGTFQQKKLAIAEEYAEKIRKAQNKGEELTLMAQRDTELRALESKAMTSQIDWYSVFDNVGVIMRGQLEPLYKQLQEYVKSDAFRKSGADNQQTVINAMDKIRSQLGTTDSWKDLSSALADYQNALNELRVATENDTRVSAELAKLTEAKNTADANLERARTNADTTPEQMKEYIEAVEAAQLALENYSSTVVANNQAMQEAQNQVQSSGTLLSMTAKNVMQPVSEIYTFLSGAGLSQLAELWGAFDELKGGIDGLKALKDIGKDTKELNDGMAEAGAALAKELPAELTEGLSKAGLIGQIISAVLKILDILKDGVGTLISSILDSIFGAISGIIDNILSGEIFKQIGESLYKGILGIFKSIFTMGGLFDWIGNGESDKNLEKDIERLTATNDALRKAVDNLATEMKEAATADMGELYKQQKADIEQSMKNTQEMMSRAGAAYSNGFLGIGGSKSSNHKINKGMSGSDWSRISQIVGKTISSAGEFWNLTSEQMAKIAQSAPDLYAKIKGLADDGYKDASQFIDEYIEYYKELEELENSFRESLTDVSFDSVKDDFKSLLLDMESDSKDFASNWEKMMQQAVINSLMNSKYNQMLKDWYNGFSDAMNDDNGLTEAEQAKLKQEWDSIVNSAIADRDSLKKAMGWDTGSGYSQEASKYGVNTLSEDTGLAIVGRMTAMQEAVESIKASESVSVLTLADLTDELIQIAMEYSRFNVHQDNIERQLARIYIELQTISENTGAIVKPIMSMQADVAEIKKYAKNL